MDNRVRNTSLFYWLINKSCYMAGCPSRVAWPAWRELDWYFMYATRYTYIRREVTLQPSTSCLTKMQRNIKTKLKSTKKRIFSEALKAHLLILVASWLKLLHWTLYRLDLRLSCFVCELSYLISKLFSKLLGKHIIVTPFVFKIKMWLVLRTSLGVLLLILLRTTDGIL